MLRRTGFLIILITGIIPARTNIHTDLSDPASLAVFEKVSSRLLCQCGCNTPLSTCNHGTCLAWSFRAVIEGMIRDGKSEEQIVSAFVKGFGGDVDDKPWFQKARKEASGSLEDLRRGYGRAMLSEPEGENAEIWILLVGILFAGVAALFIRKKLRKKPSSPSPPVTGADEELYRKIIE